jgi:predicted TIM-barrel fold metal-dependent hydrolase
VVNRRPNVYGDLALSRPIEGNVEWFVKEMGADRVLFGTDMPFYDPSHVIARVALADITEEEKKDIFYRNTAKLMKL